MTKEQLIDDWHQRHFGNVTPGTELHAQLDMAKRDLKNLFTTPDPLPKSKPQSEKQE